MMLTRRHLMAGGAAFVAAGCAAERADGSDGRFADSPFRRLTEAQWRERLPAASFRVLRQSGTERAFSSPLDNEKRAGTFVCRGCDLPLFRSDWKFDSRTGWPSFWQVTTANIGTRIDFDIGIPRTEYHCARCLGHQGHVFNDGPRPTGRRYCNNGVALKFLPA